MSLRNLTHLFQPRSIAVIGASAQPNSVGAVVMRNLLQGGFAGPIMPVNPRYTAISGVLAYPDIASLPLVPDLAVIATPPASVPDAVRDLGARGTPAAVVLAAGLAAARDDGSSLQETMLEHARTYGMRILGPNCIGVLVPGIGLNASFAPAAALPGKIAFVSQSGALCTAVLDWARPKGIGFSHFISIGDAADVDFGDVLDYLGSDPGTRAILLYIESIRQRRNFMSAARAAARNKPILAIKAGRFSEGAKAAASHTGALAGADAVYEAAFARAGMLRVYDIDELFDGVETLARSRPPRGERLAVLTNGGGIGVLAVDDLIALGGKLAELTPATIAQLDALLPPAWSRGNPIDIIGDATGSRYVSALNVLLDAPEVDAVLVMHAPTAVSSPSEIAEAVVRCVKERSRGHVAACWVGEESVAPARRLFAEAGLATFDTPRGAVRAFMHLVAYRRNQELLMETPPSAPAEFTPATPVARLLVQGALANGVDMMSEPEAKAVLSAYGIPTIETHIAANPSDAARLAGEMGGEVALKILSPDISHKSDVGGVVLGLAAPVDVEKAAEAMLDRVKARFPEARISGFTVQRMARRSGAHEVIIGVTTDPIFGPVILFGEGGTAVEIIADRTVALPPLNMSLAQKMIERTRISKLLKGYRDRPPVDMEALCLTLLKVSQLIIDIPEITELDINPLFADGQGVIALDARIKVAPATMSGADRLAIRPYPRELEEQFTLADGSEAVLRPIRPEDEPDHHIFVSQLSPEDIRFRFFGLVGELPHTEMARMTQIDYDREMAFIATRPSPRNGNETLGVVRTVTDADNSRAEFAIVVRSDLKGSGLGRRLLQKMIEYCRSRDTAQLVGQVLTDNVRMLKLIEGLGFKRGPSEGDVVEVSLALR